MDNRPILVTGATGNQGGAVARELLRRGHSVRALTRDPASEAATELAHAGAALTQGSLDDPAMLREAMRDVKAVFAVTTFATSAGVEGEVRQGRAIGDAAAAEHVPHLVFSSVDGAERASGVPHFDSKWEVERHLRGLNLPLTVLRPVFFMENFNFMVPPAANGELVVSQALPQERQLQLVSVADIGVFAALAMENPEAYIGQSLALAGDELDGRDIAAAFGAACDIPARFESQSIDDINHFGDDMVRMYEWFGTAGYEADIPALRQHHSGLLNLRDWLATPGTAARFTGRG